MAQISGNPLPEDNRSSNCVEFAKRPGAHIVTQGAPPRPPARPLELEIHFKGTSTCSTSSVSEKYRGQSDFEQSVGSPLNLLLLLVSEYAIAPCIFPGLLSRFDVNMFLLEATIGWTLPHDPFIHIIWS